MESPGRRVVVTEFISLDGVIESPSWTFPYWNDQIADFKREESTAAEALLLGRMTFEMFAGAWPTSTDEGAPQMNAFTKYVATTTLDQEGLDGFGWNGRPLGDDVPAAIRALKAEPGGDLLVYGSGRLVQTLMQHGLVDEYRLIVYPVVLGTGQRLFETTPATLELVEARPFSSGATGLIYRPAAEPAAPEAPAPEPTA